MPVTLDEFVTSLSDSGLLPSAEIRALLDEFSSNTRTADAETFASELVRQKKLTKLQAAAAYQGKTRSLVYGEYIILEKIAQGGMGEIFKARHRLMDRVVALKLLPDEIVRAADHNKIQRFQREVKAAARLEHPNIITAHDAGEAHGHNYLVMQFIEGDDLRHHVKKNGPMPVHDALYAILQAALGLEYTHNQGVVHRDIKPANLLLDRRGTVRILDMGLARFEETVAPPSASGENKNKLTQPGQVMGTVEFMSPEQAADTHDADARSDIYSLGCSLYYILTGEPPYSGEVLAHLLFLGTETPIPAFSDSRSDVPESVQLFFQKMVAQDRNERFPTMTHVITALGETGLVETIPQRAPSVRLTSDSSISSFVDPESDSSDAVPLSDSNVLEGSSVIAEETIVFEPGNKPLTDQFEHPPTEKSTNPVIIIVGALLALAAACGALWWLIG